MTVRIEAVVFDVGKVLVEWERDLPFRRLIPDAAARAQFMSEVIPLSWHGEHDAGRDARTMIAERTAQYPEHAHLIRAWLETFNETIPGPVPGSTAIVEDLHAAGVPLFAITNFGADTWAGFAPTFPLFERFGDIVVSGVEKLAKPDPAIYALAERRFGLPGQAMLFVDDSLANVASARACGWHAHHFSDATKLRAELTERGLLG
ncbi:HAD family phosphatase [Novosphingobium sp.]|uniref:HAD family hydrolase n=1 Tax=Novosphingobium sp. TaxID=1874826 RepID=UPI00286AB8DA|nr:HAD family phosphatase [Novosphingobium sp.]